MKNQSIALASKPKLQTENHNSDLFKIFEIDRCINTVAGKKYIFSHYAYRFKSGNSYLWIDGEAAV